MATLSDICTITSSKRIFRSEYKDTGVPFYRGREIIEKQKGKTKLTAELFITEEKYNEVKNKFGVPKKGDLLLTSVGTIGIPYVVKEEDKFYFKDGNLTWFKDFNNADSTYVYYWILSPSGRAQLKKATIGTSQSAYTIVLLKRLEIELPSLDEQRSISNILRNYDDLIDNNTKRIEKLEAMARLLYRHYFEVPDIENYCTLQDICSTPRESVSPSNLVPGTNYIGLEHIPRHSFGFNSIGKIDKELSLKIKFEVGDILFGKIRPYFHKVAPAPVSGVTSSDAIVIRPQDEHYGLVLMTVSSDSFVAHSVQSSNGTKMPRANWDVLKRYQIPKIDSAEEAKFNSQIITIVKLIRNITLRNEKLTKIRDLLLPRLISGEIKV